MSTNRIRNYTGYDSKFFDRLFAWVGNKDDDNWRMQRADLKIREGRAVRVHYKNGDAEITVPPMVLTSDPTMVFNLISRYWAAFQELKHAPTDNVAKPTGIEHHRSPVGKAFLADQDALMLAWTMSIKPFEPLRRYELEVSRRDRSIRDLRDKIHGCERYVAQLRGKMKRLDERYEDAKRELRAAANKQEECELKPHKTTKRKLTKEEEARVLEWAGLTTA